MKKRLCHWPLLCVAWYNDTESCQMLPPASVLLTRIIVQQHKSWHMAGGFTSMFFIPVGAFFPNQSGSHNIHVG
jgi:hypothetical protein